MSMPATIRATKNSSSPAPRPVTVAEQSETGILELWSELLRKTCEVRRGLLPEVVHRWPTSGQLATESAGGGTRKLPLLKMAIACSIDSATATPSR